MRLRAFINGFKVVDVEYELPKQCGSFVPLPQPEVENLVGIVIDGPDRLGWFGGGRLEPMEIGDVNGVTDCDHHARNPSGDCVSCGDES